MKSIKPFVEGPIIRVITFLANLLEMDDKSGLNKKSQVRPIATESPNAKDPSNLELSYRKVEAMRSFFSKFFESYDAYPTFKKLLKDTLNAVQDICKLISDFSEDTVSNPDRHYSNPVGHYRPAILFLLVDPVFRKNLLIQCKILMQILDTKIIAYEKRYQEFTKDERKLFSKTEDVLSQTAKQIKIAGSKSNLQEVLSKIVFIEKRWIDWKNKGCQNSLIDFTSNDVIQSLDKR